MKSLLGALLALIYVLAFVAAYVVYARAVDDWTAGQWLFLVALPYTLAMVKTFGTVDFSGDAPLSVATAAAFCGGLAYAAGALVQMTAVFAFRGARRLIRRA